MCGPTRWRVVVAYRPYVQRRVGVCGEVCTSGDVARAAREHGEAQSGERLGTVRRPRSCINTRTRDGARPRSRGCRRWENLSSYPKWASGETRGGGLLWEWEEACWVDHEEEACCGNGKPATTYGGG